MRPSHPATLLKLAARAIADAELLRPGDVVLVAVSGGPDSMALLDVMAALAPQLGVRILAHGIDHGIRPAAPGELDLARGLADRRTVPFATTRIELAPGGNLMARARDARYRALRIALQEAMVAAPSPSSRGLIATGHHAGDRAETVLIRLLRGSGPVGLGVLPPQTGDLIRPFVRAQRSDVMAHLERHGLPYAQDPTNRDPRFLRTRVRNELLPLMSELSPRIVKHLCDFADAVDDSVHPPAEPIPAALEGHPLGKAQRIALARALKNRNAGARVPISGGKIATVDLPSRRIVIMRGK